MRASLLNALVVDAQIRAYSMNADNQEKAIMKVLPEWAGHDFAEVARAMRHRIDALLKMGDYTVAGIEAIDDIE